MEPIKFSEFNLNKRTIAKIWGDVQKTEKTNDSRVSCFRCSRHGGYILDPKDFTSEELSKLGTLSTGNQKIKLAIVTHNVTHEEYVIGVIYPHMFSKSVKFNLLYYTFKEWRTVSVITFEEDMEWAILYKKLGIVSKNVSERVTKEELDRCSTDIMENHFKEIV